MLADTFGHTKIGDMDVVFLTAFQILVDVKFQVFILLEDRLVLDEIMMRSGYNFLTMIISATGMSCD
jgi:hypothetical protein